MVEKYRVKLKQQQTKLIIMLIMIYRPLDYLC